MKPAHRTEPRASTQAEATSAHLDEERRISILHVACVGSRLRVALSLLATAFSGWPSAVVCLCWQPASWQQLISRAADSTPTTSAVSALDDYRWQVVEGPPREGGVKNCTNA